MTSEEFNKVWNSICAVIGWSRSGQLCAWVIFVVALGFYWLIAAMIGTDPHAPHHRWVHTGVLITLIFSVVPVSIIANNLILILRKRA